MAFHREVFVGREAELAALKTALDDALAGRGRLVMLVGEPGIGKTRTADELATFARGRGAEVLWGRCPEERGAPPYWPWAQAIGAHAAALDGKVLRSELGKNAAVIAEMVPGVAERLPGLEPPNRIEDAESARFRLFDSIVSLLRQMTQARPLLVVLDDLHWADGSSLRLLEFITPEIANARILIVGAYSDVDVSRDHPLFQALGSLARQRLFERVPMRGMDEHDTGRMIAAAGGGNPPQEIVAKLRAQTDGNPLFITETVRLLGHGGRLTRGPSSDPAKWEFRIPETVREVIGRRLNLLSKECNEVLKVAAVIGREFSLDLLARLFPGTPESSLLAYLEEAARIRVIEELRRPGRHQFSHTLVQKTLADELSSTRRVRLHAQVGAAMEAIYGEDARDHATELAYHFAAAETLAGEGKVFQYSRLAGEQALAAYAYEEARSHFQRAIDAKAGGLADTEAAEVVEGLGRAEAAMLKTDQALKHLRAAFAFYVATKDEARATRIAMAPITGMRASASMAPLREQALRLVSPGSAAEGWLLVQHGRHLGVVAGDYAAAETAFDRALNTAADTGDSALGLRARCLQANVDLFHLRFPEGLENCVRAIELARDFPSPWDESHAHITAAFILVFLGEPARAQFHAAASLDAAEKLGDRERLATAYGVNQLVAQVTGDWQTARTLSDRALVSWPGDSRILAMRLLLECEVGDLDRAARLVEELLRAMYQATPGPNHHYSDPAAALPLLAHVTGRRDHLSEATRAIEVILGASSANPFFILEANIGLAWEAVLRQDVLAATVSRQVLLPRHATMVPPQTSCDRLLGLLAATTGSDDEASAHYEDSLVFCRAAGYRPELAWTCHDYANMLLTLVGAPSGRDGARAHTLLDEGQPIAVELGMQPLAAKLAALREKLSSRRGGRTGYPDGLTEREVDVLRLIAAGNTNFEIGKALVISQNTVARHVANIFAKSGASNRAEAATYANKHGLVS